MRIALLFTLLFVIPSGVCSDDMIAFTETWQTKLSGEWTSGKQLIGFQGRIVVRNGEAMGFSITSHSTGAYLCCFGKERECFVVTATATALTMTPATDDWSTGRPVITPTGAAMQFKKTAASLSGGNAVLADAAEKKIRARMAAERADVKARQENAPRPDTPDEQAAREAAARFRASQKPAAPARIGE